MNKIKNVIFDLGGVIIPLNQPRAVNRFKEMGIPDADKRLDAYTQCGIFGDLEIGKIDTEVFRMELSTLIGHEVTYDQCLYAWKGYCEDVPNRNFDTLYRLREEGFRLILLSNTNPFIMSWVLADNFDRCGHSLAYYMDAIYTSYMYKMMKPDILFFRKVLQNEEIIPTETLFIDDGPRNVTVAAELGLKTFCPANGSDWTHKIYEYLK